MSATIEEIEHSLKEPCFRCGGSGRVSTGNLINATRPCAQCAATGLQEYADMAGDEPRFVEANKKMRCEMKIEEIENSLSELCRYCLEESSPRHCTACDGAGLEKNIQRCSTCEGALRLRSSKQSGQCRICRSEGWNVD